MSQKHLKIFLSTLLLLGISPSSAVPDQPVSTVNNGGGCSAAVATFSPCLDYVSGQKTTPSGTCCAKLHDMILTEPQCYCYLLQGGVSTPGINIDQGKAKGLPATCEVQQPTSCQCNGNAGAGSGAGTGTGTGYPTTPSTGEGTPSTTIPGGGGRSPYTTYSPYGTGGVGGSVILPGSEFSDGRSKQVPHILLLIISSLLFVLAL